MALFVLLVALALGTVLAAAGVAKLRNRAALPATLAQLGLAKTLRPVLAATVPAIELGLAVALVPTASRRLAAGLAACMLVVFTVAVASTVARGKHVECGCFGGAGAETVTWRTFARNAILVAAAAAVAAQPTTWGDAARLAGTGSATLVLSLVVAALAVGLALSLRLQMGLVRRYGQVLNRLAAIEGASGRPVAVPALRAGSAVPTLTLREAGGDVVTLASLPAAAGGTLLVFAEPGCAACQEIEAELAAWAAVHPDVGVLLVSSTSPRAGGRDPGPLRRMADVGRSAFAAFSVTQTPTAALIGSDGHLVFDPAVGRVDVLAFLQLTSAARLPFGKVELLDVAGTPVAVEDAVGRDGALLFWDPGCHFCRQLLPDLQALGTTGLAPAVALVLRGPPGAESGAPLGWPALFDPSGIAHELAQARATPCLVELHGGEVAGTPVVGVSAVRAVVAERWGDAPWAVASGATR